MIETTYVRLEQAAAMLDTDADTLLIAAAEGRVRAFWLLNELVQAECGRYEETDGGPDEPPHVWVTCEVRMRHFTFIPLEWDEAAELLKSAEIEARAGWLTKPDDERNQWRPFGGMAVPENWLPESKLRVTRDYVYFERADVEAIRKGVIAKADTYSITKPLASHRSHASERLSLLNQASQRWWANASKNDPSTHPDKADVVAWLIERGMTESLAKHAATIIRPEWAHNGRKPDA
jgi:hypothetical protein